MNSIFPPRPSEANNDANELDSVCGIRPACPIPPVPFPPEPPHHVSYALASQRGTITAVGANDPLSLTDLTASCPRTYALNNDVLTITRPGVYLITATFFVPANTAFNATITVRDDGQPLPGMTVPVDSDDTAPSRTYTMQRIVTAVKPMNLAFYTSAAVGMSAPDANTTMASILAIRLE